MALSKIERRIKRKKRIRKKMSGTEGCPRLNIYRSGKYIYAQIIDDKGGRTIISASSLDKDLGKKKESVNLKNVAKIGALVAKRAQEKGIKSVVFDRGGFAYHGLVKAFADAARQNGLKF